MKKALKKKKKIVWNNVVLNKYCDWFDNLEL